MRSNKIFLSLSIFLFFLILISMIKNQTRSIEKNIIKLNKNINKLEKNLHESQIDFFYLSSPQYISEELKELTDEKYLIMKHSNIYSSINEYKRNYSKVTDSDNEKKERNK